MSKLFNRLKDAFVALASASLSRLISFLEFYSPGFKTAGILLYAVSALLY